MTRVSHSSFGVMCCVKDVIQHRHLSSMFVLRIKHRIKHPKVSNNPYYWNSCPMGQTSKLDSVKENRQVHSNQLALVINKIHVLCKSYSVTVRELPSLNNCQYRNHSSDAKSTGDILPVSVTDSKIGISEGASTDVTETVDTSEQDTDEDEEPGFKAVLSAITPNVPPPSVVEFVPGKGPPPAPPVDCCMSGCANCVWIQYAEELKNYFSVEEGSLRAKEAIEKIDNPGLQMFLKLELGLL